MFFKTIIDGKLFLYHRGRLVYTRLISREAKVDVWRDICGVIYNFCGE